MGLVKGIAEGLGIGIGFLAILYILSQISIFGIEGSVREFSSSIGQMFLELGSK